MILVWQVLFGSNVTMAVQDPSYPVNMMFYFISKGQLLFKNIINLAA